MTLPITIIPGSLITHGGFSGGYKTSWALTYAKENCSDRKILFINTSSDRDVKSKIKKANIDCVLLELETPSINDIEKNIVDNKPDIVIIDSADGLDNFDKKYIKALKYISGRQSVAMLLTISIPDRFVRRVVLSRNRFGLWAFDTSVHDMSDYITAAISTKDNIVCNVLKSSKRKHTKPLYYEYNKDSGLMVKPIC